MTMDTIGNYLKGGWKIGRCSGLVNIAGCTQYTYGADKDKMRNACAKLGKWAVMCIVCLGYWLCLCFCNFSIGCWNCSDKQCGILCFSFYSYHCERDMKQKYPMKSLKIPVSNIDFF